MGLGEIVDRDQVVEHGRRMLDIAGIDSHDSTGASVLDGAEALRIDRERVARDLFALQLGAIETELEDRLLSVVLARLTDVVGRHRVALSDLVSQSKDASPNFSQDIVFSVHESLNELLIVLLQLTGARSQFNARRKSLNELCHDITQGGLKLRLVPGVGGHLGKPNNGL